MKDNSKKQGSFSSLKGLHKAVPIILGAVAIFIALCLFVDMGALGSGTRVMLLGLFSWGAVMIPISLVVHAICYARDFHEKKIVKRGIFSLVSVLLISSIDYAIYIGNGEIVFNPSEAINGNGGGLVGGTIGYLLANLFGQIGVIIFSVAVLAIYALFFFAEKAGSLGQVALKIKAAVKKMLISMTKKHDAYVEKKKIEKEEEAQHRREAASEELIDDEFFKAKGEASSIKIKKLGIEESSDTHGLSPLADRAKRVVEEEPAEINEPETRRKRADKPLDLSYGIDDIEEPVEEAREEKKAQYDNAFLGLDDSADKVFTQDFDPFDFATSEKESAKYASKVSTTSAVAEELDDMTLYEMKANHEPTDREKRLMELEAKKKEWMQRKQAAAPAQTTTEPERATKAIPESAPVAHTPTTASVHQPSPAPVTAEAPSNVNAYTSYSSTQTTYSQPVKTVEFTITKGNAPAPTEPIEAPAVSMTFDRTDHTEEAPEDVAILISKRIAQSNPAYARSANDLKTYTKVVSDRDDELYRQLEGIKTPESPVTNETTDISYDVAPAETVTETNEYCEEPAIDGSEAEERSTETESLPDTVEFIIGEDNGKTFEPSVQSTYQRAAGFASAMVSDSTETTEFKPYTTHISAIQTSPVEAEAPTLRVERSVLTPTPVDVASNTEEVAPTSNQNTAVEIDFTPVSEPASESILTEEVEVNVKPAPATNDESPVEVSFEGDDDEDDDIPEEEESDELMPEVEEDIETEEIPPEEQNPDVIKMREMFPFLAPLDEQKPTTKPAAEEKAEMIAPVEEIDDVPFDEPVQVKIPSTSLVPASDKKPKDEKKSKKPDYSDYQFPSLDFLAKQEEAGDDNIQAEIQENADKLIETLASFGVTASIKGVDRGPRITRYEVVPAKGVKVSSILNLQDDIALNLAAGSIRMEAPIPGKSAVGIEIPNKKSSIVRLRDLLETAEFEGNKSKTYVCIGRDVAGQPVFGDLAKMPHLLIAGATGMGKSVCINSLLISVLYKARPDEVKFIMIDPKQVEFTMYNGIPHLLVPVVSDAKQAAGALMWAVEEMERRYNLLNSLYVRSVDAYNDKVIADPSLGEFLPKIIIVIDEFADLMLQVKDPVEQLVTRIAQKARAAGIHLVIGTQRPSVNVITGVIKANVPSRISCKVMSNVDSKTVLDSAGAEKLLDRGDSLYAPAGSPKPHRLQCAFVADSEVENIMKYLKQFSDGDSYDSSVMEDIKRAADKCSKKGGGADRDDSDPGESGEGYLNDRQFLDAVEIAVNTRKISTSLIQRKLSIGYGKAAKFIDIMEDMGIVGEANGQRPREVLLTPDEWREKLARASLD